MPKFSKRAQQVVLADREAQRLGQALRAYLLGLFAVNGADCEYRSATCDSPARTRIGFKVRTPEGAFKEVDVLLKFKHRIE